MRVRWSARLGDSSMRGIEPVMQIARRQEHEVVLPRPRAVRYPCMQALKGLSRPGASAAGQGKAKAKFVLPLRSEQSKASPQQGTVYPLDEASSSQQSLLLFLGWNDISPQQFLQPSLNWEEEFRLASLRKC